MFNMISIVIIEYNSLDDIYKCIVNIKQRCTSMGYEIIVSSNSCYHKEKQNEIVRALPDVRWCFNEKNGGFGYGMNQGLMIAKGEYMIVMNPDVRIMGDISILVDFLKSHKKVGAIAPQIIGHDGQIQDSCRKFLTPWRFFVRQLHRKFKGEELVMNENFDYSKIQTVDWVPGAFIMMKREVFEYVGGFDDNYFLYFEDVDLCTRIWKAGYQVVYHPKLQIEYEGSRSARKSKKYAKIFMQSQLRYWKKNGYVFGYPKHSQVFFDD